MEKQTTPPINDNKYTIGKYLRRKKGLRKKDPTYKKVEVPTQLKEYIDYLTKNGAKISKLEYAEFHLKNGLPYTGLVAQDKLISDEIMVWIPRKLILTTKNAYFSPVRKVFVENPDFFSPYRTKAWEDHMLLIFLLYEYEKGAQSDWYHVIKNLPREIDYVIYWDDKELDLLEDPILVRMAKNGYKDYLKEETYVIELSQKYPELLKPSVFTKENIRWINTHLITRCFGKYFEYVTMVPFAELFNHECIDVYYDLEYFPNNPNKPKDYSMPPAKEITEAEMETYDTSDDSYDSEDEEFDSDFDYDEDDCMKKINGELKKKSNDEFPGEIESRIREIENFVMNDLDWGDGFSIFYIKELLKEANQIRQGFSLNKLSMNAARNSIKELEIDMLIFKERTRKFYKEVYKKDSDDIKFKQKESFAKQLGDQNKEEKLFDPDEEWKDDQFDNFVMKTSWKDLFEQGSQVYFCYGRISNRMMLMRYGVTLEYNKYDHVYLKIPYIPHLKGCDWLLEKIKEAKMSRYMRFKLKRPWVNINLINYAKGLTFNLKKHKNDALLLPTNIPLEIKGIEKAIEIIEDQLNQQKISPEENKKILTDPKTGYHEYFASVYRLERQRLLNFHIRALEVLLEILRRLDKGLAPDFAVMRVHDLETEEECNRNRIFLMRYLDRLKSTLKKPEENKTDVEQVTY